MMLILVIIFCDSIIQRITTSKLQENLMQVDKLSESLYWCEVFRSAISLQNIQAEIRQGIIFRGFDACSVNERAQLLRHY